MSEPSLPLLYAPLALFFTLFALAINPFQKIKNYEHILMSPWVLLASFLTIILCSSWSLYLAFEPISDEAIYAVQSKLYLHGAIPWVDTESTTSGPIHSLWNLWYSPFSTNLSLFSLRLIGGITNAISVLLLFCAFKNQFTRSSALLLSLPVLYIYAFNQAPDVQAFHTGIVPTFLFALSFLLLTVYKKNQQRIFILGALFVTGFHFVAKIQMMPAAILFASYMIFLDFQTQKKIMNSFWCLFFFLLPTFIFVVPLIFIKNGLYDFFQSYILMATNYDIRVFLPTALMPSGDLLFFSAQNLWIISRTYTSFVLFNCILLMTLICISLIRNKRLNLANWISIGVFGLIILSMLYPKFVVPYYIALPVIPLVIAIGLLVGKQIVSSQIARWSYVAFCLFTFAFVSYFNFPLQQYDATRTEFHAPSEYTQFLIHHFNQRGMRNSQIAIWGWNPEYFIYTNSAPGTRDVIAQFQVATNPQQSYYQQRFILDLQRNRPQWFIDSTSEKAIWEGLKLEEAPEIYGYIHQHYQQTDSITYGLRRAGGLRIWKLKD